MFTEKKDYYVLVCDDNDQYALGLMHKIHEANFCNSKYEIHVDAVWSAREAEESIHSGKYDLAVLDTCFKPPATKHTNETAFREKTDYYGSSLYRSILEYCPWAKVLVTSRMLVESSKKEFNFASLEYFCKEDTTKSQLAQRVINYFDTEMKRTLNNVFVVYGHRNDIRKTVNHYLQFEMQVNSMDIYRDSTSGIKYVYDILDDFSSKAECAIILLTGDDMAITMDNKRGCHSLTYRARQNVIFEMGLFCGILGKNKVIVLHEEKENFEFPSDINGIFYIPYDKKGKWKELLRMDMQKIGF